MMRLFDDKEKEKREKATPPATTPNSSFKCPTMSKPVLSQSDSMGVRLCASQKPSINTNTNTIRLYTVLALRVVCRCFLRNNNTPDFRSHSSPRWLGRRDSFLVNSRKSLSPGCLSCSVFPRTNPFLDTICTISTSDLQMPSRRSVPRLRIRLTAHRHSRCRLNSGRRCRCVRTGSPHRRRTSRTGHLLLFQKHVHRPLK